MTILEYIGVVCQNCYRRPEDTPMIFKGDQWCSDDCRKKLTGEKGTRLSIASL